MATRAARGDERIRALVQISGPLTSPFDADTYASIISWRRRGLDEDAVRSLTELWRLEVDAMRHPTSGEHWARYRRAVRAARMQPWFSGSGYAETSPTDWFVRSYGLVSTYDPAEDVRALPIPTLWLYGRNDSQLDAAASAERFAALVRESGRPARIRVFAEADHGIFAPVDSLARPLGPTKAAPGFFAEVEGFLRGVRDAPSPRP